MPRVMLARARQMSPGADANITRSERWQEVLFRALCMVIALAPLPLGADRPLAWDMLGIAVALLLAGNAIVPVKGIAGLQKDLAIPSVLFAVVLCFIVVQISSFTPPAWHNPLWGQAAEMLNQHLAGAIAADREAAKIYLFRLICYAGIFYLAIASCRDPLRARSGIKCVAMTGAAYAAYGLIAYWSGNTTILWLTKWAYVQDLTGTFVNRNSFATYLGLCLLATLCRIFMALEGLHLVGSWRDKLETSLEFLSARWWLVISLFLTSTALFLTHSRGGLMSTLMGILMFIFMRSQAPSLRGMRRLGFVALAVMLIIGAFLISGEATIARMMNADVDAEGRLTIYKAVWQAIGDYPIFGSGIGSFPSIFDIYRPATISGLYDMAHNDYLQHLLELGIPVASIFFTAILWLVGLCVRGIRRRRRDAMFPCLGVAVTTLVALHATVDFSLQIPAVTATYAFMMGIAVAQSRSTRAA